MPGPTRTKGANIAEQVVHNILSDTVPVGKLSPTELFKVRVTKDGHTSEWPAVKRDMQTSVRLLDAANGRILKQKRRHRQLRSWLEKKQFEVAGKGHGACSMASPRPAPEPFGD